MNNVLNEANTSHRSWNNLSMQEKAAMIRVAVKNGLTDLKTIREKYNEFAGGGSKRRQESISNAATQQAMKYFMGKGLTDYQAAGLVGNLFRESRLIPTATDASSGAYGLAQWLGPRKKALFNKYGNNPTLNQQLDFVWNELNSTHRMGLKTIKSSKNAEEAARNAMGYYEFSAGPEAAIREMRRWGQDGEGAMQKGINFASQLIGGPVVPFRAETPQWNNIPFTPANPEVFFSNPVTTSQPVVDMEPTRTPMLEYDPKEAERQEKRDNLNRFNMFLGMLNGSNESTFPFSMFAEGGKINISPSKKGTFTAAASRHNMGVQEFASKVLANKDDYSSAMVRKANFAKNASKWHGLGGNLFDDGGDKDNIFKYTNSNGDVRYVYQDNPDAEEVPVRPLNTIFPDPAQWTFTDDAGKFYTPRRTTPTNTAELNSDNRTGFERTLDNYIGEAFNTVPKGYHTLPAIGAAAFGLANPALGEAALTSGFAAHGLSKWMNGEVNGPLDAAMTALELTPLGRVASPISKTVGNIERRGYETLMRTTPAYNPFPEAKENIKLMLKGDMGGVGRLTNISKYVFTGARTGPKGYYNSFADFIPLDNNVFISNPTIKQRLTALTNPKGISYGYSGFLTDAGQVPVMTEKSDMIDALLYNKDIDPSFGVKKVAIGRDFGIHKDYVNRNYYSKASEIPVYEVMTPNSIPEAEVLPLNRWRSAEAGLFDTGTGYNINAAGHQFERGISSKGTAIRQQDIWKFKGDDYFPRYFVKKGLEEGRPAPGVLKSNIYKLGLMELDRLGTPVITRTQWMPIKDAKMIIK